MNQSRPKVRKSRALGVALTPKAAGHLERRPYPPGQHGRGRKQTSDYKVRLLEKQRLRLLGGLTVPEIAAAYLVPETTMAQRLTRAKQKIARAGIPYRVPAAADLAEDVDES